MYLLVVGINYDAAPALNREIMDVRQLSRPEHLSAVKNLEALEGCIILPTNYSVEIYTATTDLSESKKYITRFLAKSFNLETNNLKDSIYLFSLNDSIRHLFRILAGLDQAFTDTGQALEQAREAYHAACENNAANHVLCILFEKAIEAAERIHDEKGAGTRAEIEAAVENELDRFLKLLNSRFVKPAVEQLKEKGNAVGNKELSRALNRLEGFSEEEKEIVKSLAESVVSELLREPVETIVSVSQTEQGHLYTEILRKLFKLNTNRTGEHKTVF